MVDRLSDGKQLVVRVPTEMKEALASLAAINERTIAQEVRRAVRQYIEREETSSEVRDP